MSLDQVKELAERQPFRPFIIRLESGHEFLIAQAKDIFLPPRKPDLVIAFTEDGLMHLIDSNAIRALSIA